MDDRGGENAVVLTVTKGVEVRARAVRDSPGNKVGGLEKTQKTREKRVVRSRVGRGKPGQDLDLPTGTTVRIRFGSLYNLKGKRGRSDGVGRSVVHEKDRTQGSFAQDFDGFEVVQI